MPVLAILAMRDSLGARGESWRNTRFLDRTDRLRRLPLLGSAPLSQAHAAASTQMMGNIGDANKASRLIHHYTLDGDRRRSTPWPPPNGGVSDDVIRKVTIETAHDICADPRGAGWTLRVFLPDQTAPIATCRFRPDYSIDTFGRWLKLNGASDDDGRGLALITGSATSLAEADGVRGRKLGHRLCAGELIRREPRTDIITLGGRILIALFRRDREPDIGGDEILLHAHAAREQHGIIVLAVADAIFRRLFEPMRRGRIIRTAAVAAIGREHREIMHGANVPLHGRPLIKRLRLIRVARDAEALFIE